MINWLKTLSSCLAPPQETESTQRPGNTNQTSRVRQQQPLSQAGNSAHLNKIQERIEKYNSMPVAATSWLNYGDFNAERSLNSSNAAELESTNASTTAHELRIDFINTQPSKPGTFTIKGVDYSELKSTLQELQTVFKSFHIAPGTKPTLSALDHRQSSLLLLAAKTGKSLAVKALAASNPTLINQQNIKGTSPLSTAAEEGHTSTVRALLDLGATVDLSNTKKQTPLFIAASQGNTNIVSMLIKANANKNAQDENGMTPIAAATSTNRVITVHALATLGANTTLADNKGTSPQAIARDRGHDSVADMLNRFASNDATNSLTEVSLTDFLPTINSIIMTPMSIDQQPPD